MSRTFNPDAYGRPLPATAGAKGPDRNGSPKEKGTLSISHPRDRDRPHSTVYTNLEYSPLHSHVPAVKGNSEDFDDHPRTSNESQAYQVHNPLNPASKVTIKQQASIVDVSQPIAAAENQAQQRETHTFQNHLQSQHARSGSKGDSKTQKLKSAATMDTSDQIAARNDRLRMLQDASLRKITRKAAARKEKDKNNTVSMRDLDLARAPVLPDEPMLSSRPWAVDSPLYDDDIQRCEIVDVFTTKHLSNVPQHTSTNASQIHVTNQSQQIPAGSRNARWAVKDEMKCTKQEIDINAWGSAVPSDATRPSNDSDASFGRLLRNREPTGPEEAIYDWEGKMMPPPEEWAERRRYNNNNAHFKASFKQYVSGLQERFGNGVQILPVPAKVLQNPKAHPDGISMCHRSETISLKNAAKYGYQDPERATIYAQTIDDAQFEVDCKLDFEDEGNATFDREETTEKLVTNWNNHIANSRGQYINVKTVPKVAPQRAGIVHREVEVKEEDSRETSSTEEEEFHETSTVPLMIPKLNIYLRPATVADLQELTRMYNWYVTNNCQPAELVEVDLSSMQSRMEFCIASKLPFIVAAKKSQKGAIPIPPPNDEMISRQLGLPVTHKTPIGLTRVEKLAGFCCANDFTQPDFIEHISAEIEVYVDHQYRRMGVGKALMDRMLQICDPGYRLRIDVPFHCDAEVRHLYGPGGGRNIHKMIVLLRKWHTPALAMTVEKNVMSSGQRKGGGRFRRSTKKTMVEDEYAQWVRTWFENVGFEVEGHIKRMGAKHGRYVDLVYFGRETSWQPAEGEIPSPAPEFMNATIGDSTDGG